MAISRTPAPLDIGKLIGGGNAPPPTGEPIQFDINDPDKNQEPADDGDHPEDPDAEHFENLVPEIDERIVTRIGKQCIEWFKADLRSRERWEETIKKGIESLGTDVMTSDDGDAPFDGACMATHPLVLETAIKFQSKATAELLPATGPVRTQVLGIQSEPALQKANRVKEFMNYQITKLMPEYYPDMEKLLFYLPLYGSAFKKTYWDFGLGRPVSCFVTTDNFVINNNAKSLEKARRYSEIITNVSGAELKNMIMDQGLVEPKEWRQMFKNDSMNSRSPDQFDITGEQAVGGVGSHYQTQVGIAADVASGHVHVDGMMDKVFTLVEMHCFLALPPPFGEPGFTDPYIVTFLQDTGEVLSIKRNWDQEDINRKKKVWFSHYSYVPGFGFYGFGLFHLLGNIQSTLTSVLRSLVDAGQFANMQGGLKLKGLRILGDGSAIAPGEWRDVESAIQDLSKSLFPLPYKEPSTVLFQLLQWLDTRGGAFADSTEQVIADSTNYGPVGTTMALLEASMKLFTAIHKRTHLSQEQDLKLLYQVNSEYMPKEYPYDVAGGQNQIFKEDFDPKVVNVIPVSDPNIISNAHRLAQAQAKLQAGLQQPQIHNMKKLYRDFYLALGEEDIDALVPPDQQASPMGPMEDIMAVTQGKPIKAFPGQEHRAHIQFKSTWLEDPIMGGKSPTMQQYVPMVLANIREHQMAQMQEQVQGAVNEKAQGQQDPKVIAQIQAQAYQEVKKANEALAQVLGGDDPMHVVAQAEMLKAQTEAERVKHVKVKDLADLSLKAQSIDIDRFLAQIKGKEANMGMQLEQFKAGVTAVQQGLQNLQKEADAKFQQAQNQQDLTHQANQHALSMHNQKQQSVTDAMGNIIKLQHDHTQHKLNLSHTAQTHQQKLDHAKELAAIKAAQLRKNPPTNGTKK
jgi:hypothetical protein